MDSDAVERYVVSRTAEIDSLLAERGWFLSDTVNTVTDRNVPSGTYVYHVVADDSVGYHDYLYYDFVVVRVE